MQWMSGETLLTSRGMTVSSRRAQSSLLALPKSMGTCSSNTGAVRLAWATGGSLALAGWAG